MSFTSLWSDRCSDHDTSRRGGEFGLVHRRRRREGTDVAVVADVSASGGTADMAAVNRIGHGCLLIPVSQTPPETRHQSDDRFVRERRS